MTKDEFWTLIHEANASAPNTKAVPEWLEHRLSSEPTKEIVDFEAWLAMFMDRADDEVLWAGGSIVAGSLSGDAFTYFRCWLVAQGCGVFETVVAAPDSLADLDYKEWGMSRPIIQLEGMLYVATDAFNRRVGKPRFSRMELPPAYQPPLGCDPVSKGRRHQGFLQLAEDIAVAKERFPKLTRRFLTKTS